MTLNEYLAANPDENWRSLAKRVGCSHNHLFQIGQGQKWASLRVAQQINEATGGQVNPTELCGPTMPSKKRA